MSQLQTDLHFSAEMLSLCLGISLFATGLGGILFGALGDRYGRKEYCNGRLLSIQSGHYYADSHGHFTHWSYLGSSPVWGLVENGLLARFILMRHFQII